MSSLIKLECIMFNFPKENLSNNKKNIVSQSAIFPLNHIYSLVQSSILSQIIGLHACGKKIEVFG